MIMPVTMLALFGAGTYTLIDYGTLSGSIANLGTPTGPEGFDYELIDTGSLIRLQVTEAVPGLPGDYTNVPHLASTRSTALARACRSS